MTFFYLISQGKYQLQYEDTEEFKQKWKQRVREILTEQEWRRRKMQMRVSIILLFHSQLFITLQLLLKWVQYRPDLRRRRKIEKG